MIRRKRPIFADGCRVAVCDECGSVHFQLLGAGDQVVAVALLSPEEAIGAADLLMEAATEIRKRDTGGHAACH